VCVKPLLADPVFPGLGVASNPEIMQGVFADYLRPLRGGTYRGTDCHLSRVRYRRGTRCVLQYTLRLADSDTGHEPIQWVTGVMYAKDRTRRVWERFTMQARGDTVGRTHERRFYAKVYRDEGGERAYRALQALRSRADEDNEKFTVAAPIAYLGELKVLLQEETLGTSLQEMIVQEEDASLAVRKAAEALAALHLEHIATPQRHFLPNEVAALERTETILRWACPRMGAEIEETVGTVVASLEEVPPAPTHRDLKLDHILLDGDRPSLVDLGNFAAAAPVLDVANVGRSDAGRLS